MSGFLGFESFAGFAWPWMGLLLPLPWLAGWLLPVRRSRTTALRLPENDRLDAANLPSQHTVFSRSRWLPWLIWILLCMAAARPQQYGEMIEPPLQGRQMMLAVDLSGSMSEPDMALNGRPVDRLTAAKAVLADFLERRTGDRIGLLVFGERAYVLAPLTLDHDSVRDQLRDSVVGLAGRDTAMGDAIALAVKRLREREGDRVLILLTDGVNTAGMMDPLRAAEMARIERIRVYTIAFGGDSLRQLRDLFGVAIPARTSDSIDEHTLETIAESTGGRFFRAHDTQALAAIYAELNRLEPVAFAGQTLRPKIEKYFVPLMWAFGLSIVALLWRGYRQ